MKTIKKLIYVAAILAVAAALAGCSYTFKTSYIYDNGENYTAGDREITEKVEEINIDYVSGDVKLKLTDSKNVSIKETSNLSD